MKIITSILSRLKHNRKCLELIKSQQMKKEIKNASMKSITKQYQIWLNHI